MPKTLRHKLLNRPLPQHTFPIQVADPTEPMAALAEAGPLWRQARIKASQDPEYAAGDEYQTARLRHEAAETAVQACTETVTVRALKPADYEALVAAHPPTTEQVEQGEEWNPDTFRPALLEACVDGDMTADDWTVFLTDHASKGEGQALFVTALGLNAALRVADPSVPKDWTSTLNSLSS